MRRRGDFTALQKCAENLLFVFFNGGLVFYMIPCFPSAKNSNFYRPIHANRGALRHDRLRTYP